MPTPLEDGAVGKVLVRLSDVPESKRVAVAERIIRVEGIDLVNPDLAIILRMRAIMPRQNPALLVDAASARRVCGRLP